MIRLLPQTVAKTAFAVAFGIAVTAFGGTAFAQNKPTPAGIGYAKEILALKNAPSMYQSIVPNLVQRTKETLMQSNLNYQKDLNEVAIKVARDLSGREKEITEEMGKIYASDFTEVELKDLLAFYKTPLGKKVLEQEPKSIQSSINYMNQWAQNFAETINGAFRAEMKARGKEI